MLTYLSFYAASGPHITTDVLSLAAKMHRLNGSQGKITKSIRALSIFMQEPGTFLYSGPM